MEHSDATDLLQRMGRLARNAERRKHPPPVAERAADAADKKAQESRSSKYGIGIKEGGNVTKPSEWSSVPDSEWGDPVSDIAA